MKGVGLIVAGFAASVMGCTTDRNPPVSSIPEPERTEDLTSLEGALTVGGCQCPSWHPGVTCAELTYSDIPPDNVYYVTTFGGPGDGQDMWICGHKTTDNGSWPYVADYQRFGCGKVLIKNPATNKSCVGEVADCGPNRCVEEAACFCGCASHHPILDVSPFITQYLFGISSSGWSERRKVIAYAVDPSTPIGCPGGVVCTSHHHQGCHDGDVYWYDSCGHLEGKAAECDDGNPCTNDGCSNAACTHATNSNSCDDGDPCTVGDTCTGGACGGAPMDCSPLGGPCRQGVCVAGECLALPLSGPCEDGDPCTVQDHCEGGVCLAGPQRECEDGDPCTVDTCDPGAGGCVHAVAAGCCLSDADCDDGDPCTEDRCEGEVCEHAPGEAIGKVCEGDNVVAVDACGNPVDVLEDCAPCGCLDGSCLIPDCEGRECGPDGCGGSCGRCPEGEACVYGPGVAGAWCVRCAPGEECAGGPGDHDDAVDAGDGPSDAADRPLVNGGTSDLESDPVPERPKPPEEVQASATDPTTPATASEGASGTAGGGCSPVPGPAVPVGSPAGLCLVAAALLLVLRGTRR